MIQGSAGEATICVLLAAILRQQRNADAGKRLERSSMVVYASDQTHTVALKACRILGVQFRTVKTHKSDSYGLQANAVAAAIAKDVRESEDLIPIAVIATTGTTSSCAFDDLVGIAKVCHVHQLWLHVVS